MNTFKAIRFFALIFALISTFAGCKKDDSTSGGNYYMRFKVDGTEVSYTGQTALLATFIDQGTSHSCSVSGYDANSNMTLQIFDTKQVKDSTYSDYQVASSGTTLVGVIAGYKDAAGTNYSGSSSPTSATVTISELTGTTAKGTFSGILKANGHANISITAGEFFVKRQ